MKTETEVWSALRKIWEIGLSDLKKGKPNGYALAYARAGIGLEEEALKTQCLYVLNNIQHWRHPDAKGIRETLKDYVKKS